MKKIYISSPLLSILPSLTLIPIVISLYPVLHNGGFNLFHEFIKAAITPSMSPIVLQSAWNGLKITFLTASLSWLFSTFIGLILGLASSITFWQCYKLHNKIAIFFRTSLAIPRSIHELVWALIIQSTIGINPLAAIIALSIPYSALVARVVSDQVDCLDKKSLIALIQGGAHPISAFTSAIAPKAIPKIISYIGYRFECSLRGATILGMFGMGGIGSELQLSIRSLQFKEVWTSLWMLLILIILIEQIINYIRTTIIGKGNNLKKIIVAFIPIVILIIVCIYSALINDNFYFTNIKWHPINWPYFFEELRFALIELNWPWLISSTLLITILAAGIAIGIPPLIMMIWPSELGIKVQTIIWTIFRLFPPPLIALLLLIFTTPSISVAALALGIHNIGVLGRLLKEGIDQQKENLYEAISSTGADIRTTWLYSRLCKQSKSYLAFAAYRTDVLLRQTAAVGVVGGIGLGWQLQESISSFNWAQISLVVATYTLLTWIGEIISDKSRKHLLDSKANDLSNFH